MGSTAFLLCDGRALATISPSQEQNLVDTVLTDLCFSQLGTGPTWPYTRQVSFHEFLRRQILIKLPTQQAVQKAALDIAQQYADQDHWTAVARNLRVPFWDWAATSVPPDEVIALENVNIITPDGNQNSVPNPFLRYSFNPIDPSFTLPWDQYQTTVRHPENQDPVEGLRRCDMTLPHSTFAHSFFTKVICLPPGSNLPSKPITFSRAFILGPLSATTRPRMVAALVTPWKPFMTRFM